VARLPQEGHLLIQRHVCRQGEGLVGVGDSGACDGCNGCGCCADLCGGPAAERQRPFNQHLPAPSPSTLRAPPALPPQRWPGEFVMQRAAPPPSPSRHNQTAACCATSAAAPPQRALTWRIGDEVQVALHLLDVGADEIGHNREVVVQLAVRGQAGRRGAGRQVWSRAGRRQAFRQRRQAASRSTTGHPDKARWLARCLPAAPHLLPTQHSAAGHAAQAGRQAA
jgi:hypothetical protein